MVSLAPRAVRHRVLLSAGWMALLLCIAVTPATAQSADGDARHAWTTRLAADAILAPDAGPAFWAYSNQHGTVDASSSNALVRAFAERTFQLPGTVDAAVGVELLGRSSAEPGVFAHQLYGRFRSRGIELQAGLWEDEPSGLLHSTLSIGSLGRSRNAQPVPKVALQIPSYTPVPGTGDVVSVRGYFAHGWLGTDRYVRNALLQDKALYVRIFRPDQRAQLHVGLLMHTIWGGTHPTIGDLPDGPMTFLRVMGGRAGDVDAPEIEQDGSLGASAAGYDLGLSFSLPGADVMLTRYFHHTDRPSLFFRNPWDGIWGVRVERPDSRLVETVLWNHLRTTRQNAKFSEGEERGEDTYYNNSLYRSGWTFEGRVLGSPLLLPNDRGPGVSNNIVIAHHIGIGGRLPGKVDYRLRATYSRNYGAQSVCADAACTQLEDRRTSRTDQYSIGGELSRSVNALTFRAGVSADSGALYADRVSVLVGFSWKASRGAIF
ncbi:capsule assembly Wzi family protein [Longibacter sp.]|uniref:capsule assembly Wzi family protein n=1 Tax=Longibacter sp. TaxID=2045415 RepID=UPI003EC03092